MIEECKMKRETRRIIVLLLLAFSIPVLSGCAREKETLYNRRIVVELMVLPFYESSLTYNAETEQTLATKLSSISQWKNDEKPQEFDYIIVNHDGDDLTDDFPFEEDPSYQELLAMAKEIKQKGYLVVDRNSYRITTIEKEIKALFRNERYVYPADKMKDILEDNKVAFKNKDYESINLYLMKQGIIVSEKRENR
jgi:hypothetical protein